jgi:hypothetical protein
LVCLGVSSCSSPASLAQLPLLLKLLALRLGGCNISLSALYYSLLPKGLSAWLFAGFLFVFSDRQSTRDGPTNHISVQTIVFHYASSSQTWFGFSPAFGFLSKAGG